MVTRVLFSDLSQLFSEHVASSLMLVSFLWLGLGFIIQNESCGSNKEEILDATLE